MKSILEFTLLSVLIAVTVTKDLYFGLFNVKNQKDSRLALFGHQNNSLSSEPNQVLSASETKLFSFDSRGQIGCFSISDITVHCLKSLKVEFPYKSLTFEEGMRFPDIKLNEKPSIVTQEAFLQAYAKRKLNKSMFLIEDVDESLFINAGNGNCLFFVGNSRFVVSRTIAWLKTSVTKIRSKLVELDRAVLNMTIEKYNDDKLREVEEAIGLLYSDSSKEKVDALKALKEQLKLSNWILTVTSFIYSLVNDTSDRAVNLTLEFATSTADYLTAIASQQKHLLV